MTQCQYHKITQNTGRNDSIEWRNENDAMKKTQWKRRNEKDAMMRRWSTCARQTLIVNFWISFVRNLSTRSPYIVYVEKRHQRSRLEKNHRIFILFGDVCEMRWDANLPCLVGNPIQSFFKQELQDKQWSKWCCDGDGLSLSLSKMKTAVCRQGRVSLISSEPQPEEQPTSLGEGPTST